MHADWVLLNAQVPVETKSMPRLCLVRPHDIEVVDTWHVDGMVATGSRDIVANALFVPTDSLRLTEARWPIEPIGAHLALGLLGLGRMCALRVAFRKQIPLRSRSRRA